MKPTGIIRRIDDLGRIVIPRAVRKEVFGVEDVTGKPMEIFYEKDGTIILKPYMVYKADNEEKESKYNNALTPVSSQINYEQYSYPYD